MVEKQDSSSSYQPRKPITIPPKQASSSTQGFIKTKQEPKEQKTIKTDKQTVEASKKREIPVNQKEKQMATAVRKDLPIIAKAQETYQTNQYIQAADEVDFESATRRTGTLLVSYGLLTNTQLQNPDSTIQAIFTSFYTMKLVREENATKKTIELLKSIMEEDGVEINPQNILKYLWDEGEKRSRLAEAMVGQQIGGKKVSQNNARWWGEIFRIVYERSNVSQQPQISSLQKEHDALLKEAELLLNSATDYQKAHPAFQSLSTIYQTNKNLATEEITQETNQALKNAITEAKKVPSQLVAPPADQQTKQKELYSYNNEFANIDHPLAKHLHNELQTKARYLIIISSNLLGSTDKNALEAASHIAESYVDAIKSNITFFEKFYDKSKSFGENVVVFERHLQTLDWLSLLDKEVQDSQGNKRRFSQTDYFINMGYMRKEGNNYVVTDTAPAELANTLKKGGGEGAAQRTFNKDAFNTLSFFGLATMSKNGKVTLNADALKVLPEEEQTILKNFVAAYNSNQAVKIYERQQGGQPSPAEVMVKLVRSHVYSISTQQTKIEPQPTPTGTPTLTKQEENTNQTPTPPPRPGIQPQEEPEARRIVNVFEVQSDERRTQGPTGQQKYRYNNELANIEGLERVHTILSTQWDKLVSAVTQKLNGNEDLALQKIQKFVVEVQRDSDMKSLAAQKDLSTLSVFIVDLKD